MNKIIHVILLVFVLLNSALIVSAYGKDDIMGDPGTSLEPIAPQIKWLTGSFTGGLLIAAVLGILAGGIVFFYGSTINKSETKGQGISGIIGSIGVTLLVTVGLTLLFALHATFY